MEILHQILDSLPDGETLDVRIGLHWTAVVADVGGVHRCGLASTLHGEGEHGHEPDVGNAGRLCLRSAGELARLVLSERPTQVAVGMAAINALLPRLAQRWSEENAEDVIARHGEGRSVAMVGRFPFARRLQSRVGRLTVLEQHPGPDDLPAERAPDILPNAEVVAITGMTFTNRTLQGLLELCAPGAFVIVLGPTTPLSPVLFDWGVSIISGAVVTAIDPVLRVLVEGGTFRQVHPAGVRLVNMTAEAGEMHPKEAGL